MSWESRYTPPDPSVWQGRADVPADSLFYQHVLPFNLLAQTLQPAIDTFALIGFKCDEGIQRDLGRSGAAEGPTAIRQTLGKLPIQKPQITVLDVGNIHCDDHDMEASQLALADVVTLLMAHNIRPIIIGGGHEVAWGHYQGIARHHAPEKRLGMINFDAHFDLEPLAPSHRASATTVFYQIANAHQAENRHLDYNCIGIQHSGNVRQAFALAKKFGTRYIFADELHQGQQEKCLDFTDRIIDENDVIYVSISLDVFSSAYAPGVSNVQPLGLTPWHVIPLLRQIAASGKVVSYDIAEHAPRYDMDHRTAKLAAALIYEIIHHHHEHNSL